MLDSANNELKIQLRRPHLIQFEILRFEIRNQTVSYLALGTRQGISTWSSWGRPRKPWNRSNVTWVMCRTFVGHPISILWTAEEIPPPIPPSSCRLSTRQDTTDFRSAVRRNSTRDSCWFCSSSSSASSTADFPLPPFPPPQPTPLVTITSPVIAHRSYPQKKRQRSRITSRTMKNSQPLSLSLRTLWFFFFFVFSLFGRGWVCVILIFEVLEKVSYFLFYFYLN